MIDEEVAVRGQDKITQKLGVIMKMLRDLLSRVKATEDQQGEMVVTPIVSPSTSHPMRRRVR